MVKLIKLCLNEPQSTVQLGKHLPDTFSTRNGLEQGDDLLPFFFKFALEYAITRVQINQDGLVLNVYTSACGYTDGVNIGWKRTYCKGKCRSFISD